MSWLTLCMVLLIVVPDVARGYYDENWPWKNIIFNEGATGYIPCPVKGDTNAYFWEKGEAYSDSTIIANNILASNAMLTNASTDRFLVLDNGTLVISGITTEDTGGYFCRVVTETCEYFGIIWSVYIRAWRGKSLLSIDGCHSLSTCIKNYVVGSEQKIICTASFVLPRITLTWFNISTILPSITTTKENPDGTFNVSSESTLTYDNVPALLTCEANGISMEKKYKSVMLQTKVNEEGATKTSSILLIVIIIAVASVVCVVILATVILKGRSRNNKNKENQDGEMKKENQDGEDEALLSKDQVKLSEITDVSEEDTTEKSTKNNVPVKPSDTKNNVPVKPSDTKELSQEESLQEERALRRKELNRKPRILVRVKLLKKESKIEGIDEIIWKTRYGMTATFQADKIPFEVEELIQHAVDGGKACIFAFDDNNRTKPPETVGSQESPEAYHDLIHRSISKIFESKQKLEEARFMVKIQVSNVTLSQKQSSQSSKTAESSLQVHDEGTFFVTNETEAFEIASKSIDGEKTCTILKLFIETLVDGGKKLSEGKLTLVIFYQNKISEAFLKQEQSNAAVQMLMPIINEKNLRRAFIITISSDRPKDISNAENKLQKIKGFNQPLKTG